MRKKKYIPHLAEFHFQPKYNWSIVDSLSLYNNQESQYMDEVIYEDCIKVMKKMKPESVDVVIADPPFGINFTGKETLYNRKSANIVENYNEITDDYKIFSELWISCLPRIMKPTSSAWIISGYTNLGAVLTAIEKSGLKLINHIVWKYQFGPFTSRKFVSSHYHILFVVKNPKKYFFHRISHYNLDVWDDIPRTYKPRQKKNGTKLPEELIKRILDFSSKPGELIFDPFMGNGTTAVTSKMNFRHFYGCEINKNMRKIIETNLAQIKLGEEYKPYRERLKTLKQLSENGPEYMKAYLHFIKENNLEIPIS